jgi:hypothetical protein
MFKRVALLILAVGALGMSGWAINPNQVVRPKRVERISQLVQTLGSGENSLVAVRLKDKTAIAGHVEEAGEDSFTVIEKGSGESVKVSYYKIDRLQGYNLETGTEIHEGTGIRAKLARMAMKVLPGQEVPVNSLTGGQRTLLIGIIIGIILAIVLSKVF